MYYTFSLESHNFHCVFHTCMYAFSSIQGYISYPRTETTKYPKDFDFKSVLGELKKHHEFGEYASTLLQSGYKVRR